MVDLGFLEELQDAMGDGAKALMPSYLVLHVHPPAATERPAGRLQQQTK